ncbi:Cysteine-rich motor neuron 1 protein-like [Homarus americanus]|uniref:Cysteine-rich motor neuron 1 protein-like n=1 Tax=Homarus americanus TaxID=6706 RepID=A0A8J5JS13_HOMAM|nr:Cysteine-rich motor neuron 1 protein-like [Homarus americanus]
MNSTCITLIIVLCVWTLVKVTLCLRHDQNPQLGLRHHPGLQHHNSSPSVVTSRLDRSTSPSRKGDDTGRSSPNNRRNVGGGSGKVLEDNSVLLRCPPCSKVHCEERRPRRLRCPGGVTRGVCGCCPVCAKTLGQVCGGALGYLGRCDAGLTCHLREPVVWTYRADASLTYYSRVSGICETRSEADSSSQRGWWQEAGTGEQPTREVLPGDVSLCQPPCTHHYCASFPNAICSASNGRLRENLSVKCLSVPRSVTWRLHLPPWRLHLPTGGFIYYLEASSTT